PPAEISPKQCPPSSPEEPPIADSADASQTLPPRFVSRHCAAPVPLCTHPIAQLPPAKAHLRRTRLAVDRSAPPKPESLADTAKHIQKRNREAQKPLLFHSFRPCALRRRSRHLQTAPQIRLPPGPEAASASAHPPSQPTPSLLRSTPQTLSPQPTHEQ